MTLKGIEDVKAISLKQFADERGQLSIVESFKDVPFSLKRIFYVHGVPVGETRGHHAHRLCQQVFICLAGAIHVTCDDGSCKREFVLNDPATALHVPPSIWAEEKYLEKNSLLLVLTDRSYEPSDYLRDYSEFLQFRGLIAS